ncbi:hypothetical protein BC829DRAFT_391953 [Chytridium lagenaria]|nr:hypothetical protein BC829DRAFT_391953 [Chytridium lagenaria]
MSDELRKRREARRAKILASGEDRLSKITQMYGSASTSEAVQDSPSASPMPTPSETVESPPKAPPTQSSPPKEAHDPYQSNRLSQKSRNISPLLHGSHPEPMAIDNDLMRQQLESMPMFQKLLADQGMPGSMNAAGALAGGVGGAPAAPTMSRQAYWLRFVRGVVMLVLAGVALWSTMYTEEFEGEDMVAQSLVAPFSKRFDVIAPAFEFYGMEISIAMLLISVQAMLLISHFMIDPVSIICIHLSFTYKTTSTFAHIFSKQI